MDADISRSERSKEGLLMCVFPNTTKQFFNPQRTLTGFPTNLIKFLHCLPGDSIKSHKLRAYSHKIAPTSHIPHKSRLSLVLLIGYKLEVPRPLPQV